MRILTEHATGIINFEKKKNMFLTNEHQKPYENAQVCHVCNEKFEDKHAKYNKYCKFRDHCHYTGDYRSAAHSICNLKYSVPKEISIVFHNRCNCDYHFVIK